MKNILYKIYKKLFLRSYKAKRNYLIKQGAKIGENTRIIADISSFGTEPYLVEIGKNCLISNSVDFMTHDGGISVLNNLNYFGERMDKLGRIKIGNNCFIGMYSKIMPGVSIGNNVVIGLGSIVTKDIPSNSVACGVPAKVIKTIEEYGEGIKDKIYPTTKLSKEEKRKYCEKNIL